MKQTTEIPESLQPYRFHGVEFSVNGTQAVGTCPFCSAQKFYINKESGQYSCKRCGEEGNKYTFMSRIFKSILEERTRRDMAKISQLRGGLYPLNLIREKELCFHNGCVVFPVPKPGKQNLVNIRRWDPESRICYNTSTCCSLWYCRWAETGPVYICEGEWDAMSLELLFTRAKHDFVSKPISIVATPGATTVKPFVSNPLFEKRDCLVLYDFDHDKRQCRNCHKPVLESADKCPNCGEKARKGDIINAGKTGTQKVCEVLAPVASSVSVIDWSRIGSDLKDGYDITDFVSQAVEQKKSKRFLRRLLKSVVPFSSRKAGNGVQPLIRTSFSQVVDDFQEHLEFNRTFVDVLACCFSTMVTLFMSHEKTNPLWLFVVAPASSGKTTIIESFDAATDYTRQLSRLTPASLVTGLNMKSEYDPSLLSELRDMVLFIKDFTPVLTMGGDKEQVFGIFRDAYDGAYIARFATGVREYRNLYFGIVAGVTHAIERVNMSDLGERFLRICLIDDRFDELAHIEKALANVDNTVDVSRKEKFQASVLGFIQHLMKNLYQPEWNHAVNRKLAALSRLAALCRTEVPRNSGNRDMYYRPTAEIASRIATQLKKLGLGLAVVYGRQSVDDDCYRIMQRVAMDSCIGWKLELVQTLAFSEPMSVLSIANRMQVHQNQVRRIIDDCQQLRMVDRAETSSGIRGRKSALWKLSPRVEKLIEQSEIRFNRRRRRCRKKG